MTVSLVGRMAIGSARSVVPLLVTQATWAKNNLDKSRSLGLSSESGLPLGQNLQCESFRVPTLLSTQTPGNNSSARRVSLSRHRTDLWSVPKWSRPTVSGYNNLTHRSIRSNRLLLWPCIEFKNKIVRKAIQKYRRSHLWIPISEILFFLGFQAKSYKVIRKIFFIQIVLKIPDSSVYLVAFFCVESSDSDGFTAGFKADFLSIFSLDFWTGFCAKHCFNRPLNRRSANHILTSGTGLAAAGVTNGGLASGFQSSPVTFLYSAFKSKSVFTSLSMTSFHWINKYILSRTTFKKKFEKNTFAAFCDLRFLIASPTVFIFCSKISIGFSDVVFLRKGLNKELN